MNNATPTLRNALFAILLLTLLAVGMMASVPTLDAATNCTYYSDATYTTVVGQYGSDCCSSPAAPPPASSARPRRPRNSGDRV